MEVHSNFEEIALRASGYTVAIPRVLAASGAGLAAEEGDKNVACACVMFVVECDTCFKIEG